MSADLRAAIETLLATWARCIDGGRAVEAIDLYAEDAQQTMPHGTAVGREAIRAGLQRRQALVARTSRHLVGNLVLQPGGDAQQLQGWWTMTVFRSDTQDRPAVIQLVADVEDTYRHVDGRWLIARRTVTPIFGSP